MVKPVFDYLSAISWRGLWQCLSVAVFKPLQSLQFTAGSSVVKLVVASTLEAMGEEPLLRESPVGLLEEVRDGVAMRIP